MAKGPMTRLKHAWNAFVNNRDPTPGSFYYGGYSHRPDRTCLSRASERTIVTSLATRIAMDVAAMDFRHVRLEDGCFKEEVDSPLNRCFKINANVDQTGRAMIQDAVLSMLQDGTTVIVPIDTDDDPLYNTTYGIETLRVGKVTGWYPNKVTIDVYNELVGRHQEITMPKRTVAIVENPLYSIMNEPNSTVQRLIRKLSLLDITDENTASGKLDLIIQLPYMIKSEGRKQQAEERRRLIEEQLAGSKYGIAYTDGTERITQLNRSLENNLLKQIEYLTSMVYSQLGASQAILEGTAEPTTMQNYYSRTISPLATALCEAMSWKFLSDEARENGETIMFFNDPFRLVPVSEMAELADKFTRNEIMSSNEFRQKIGMRPSDDPRADMLINSNLNHPEEELEQRTGEDKTTGEGEDSQNGQNET